MLLKKIQSLSIVFLLFMICSLVTVSYAQNKKNQQDPVIIIETSLGNITLNLFQNKAPLTVKNFLGYVKENFYEGTIFHRVKKGVLIQGGTYTQELTKKQTHNPIKNEADNKIKNKKGTVAMARSSKIDSATSQFFINLKDNPNFDHQNASKEGYGYCVFGKVTEGMEVVKKIGEIDTASKGDHKNVPVEPILINSVRIVPHGKSNAYYGAYKKGYGYGTSLAIGKGVPLKGAPDPTDTETFSAIKKEEAGE